MRERKSADGICQQTTSKRSSAGLNRSRGSRLRIGSGLVLRPTRDGQDLQVYGRNSALRTVSLYNWRILPGQYDPRNAGLCGAAPVSITTNGSSMTGSQGHCPRRRPSAGSRAVPGGRFWGSSAIRSSSGRESGDWLRHNASAMPLAGSLDFLSLPMHRPQRHVK